MHFERTFDYGLVKCIATEPHNFLAGMDDFSSQEWEPIRNEAIWYVLTKDGEEILGMFVFIPENAVCWRAHICLLPNSYGKRAREAGKGVIQWIFSHTVCERIVGEIEAENTLALRYVSEVGLLRYGFNPLSKKKYGRLQDQVCVGVSKSWA